MNDEPQDTPLGFVPFSGNHQCVMVPTMNLRVVKARLVAKDIENLLLDADVVVGMKQERRCPVCKRTEWVDVEEER